MVHGALTSSSLINGVTFSERRFAVGEGDYGRGECLFVHACGAGWRTKRARTRPMGKRNNEGEKLTEEALYGIHPSSLSALSCCAASVEGAAETKEKPKQKQIQKQ